jgi:hypothetical protein
MNCWQSGVAKNEMFFGDRAVPLILPRDRSPFQQAVCRIAKRPEVGPARLIAINAFGVTV